MGLLVVELYKELGSEGGLFADGSGGGGAMMSGCGGVVRGIGVFGCYRQDGNPLSCASLVQ